MQAVQALEIEITPVHHIEGARLGQQFVQDVDVVQFPVGNVDEARDVAAQIDQRVQFARCFGRTKRCPREQRKAQVDRGRIQRVDGLLQIHAEGLVHVKPARDADQVLRELGVDSPVARFVRIGQRAPGHRAANTQVVELRALGTKARFDVAQALAIGELCKCHAAELIRTTETAHTRVAAINDRRCVRRYSTAGDPSTARIPICPRACASLPSKKPPESRISTFKSETTLKWHIA